MKMRCIAFLLIMGLAVISLGSCADGNIGDNIADRGEESIENTEDKTEGSPVVADSTVRIQLDGDRAICQDSSVYVEEGRLTITAPGTYAVTGAWNNGQIWVDCMKAGDLHLVLENAEITNDDGACIVFRKATTATLTLADGTVNRLTDGSNYVFDNPADDEPDGALFSKEDLVITGSGTLVVNGNYKCGIVSKDGLTIRGGVIDVAAVGHGIRGKDYVVIDGGTVTVEALEDGIKSTNEESDTVGFMEINGGTVEIFAGDEAISAITNITVNGGSVDIDSTNNGIRTLGKLIINGGTVTVEAEDNTVEALDVELTGEGALTVRGIPYQQ